MQCFLRISCACLCRAGLTPPSRGLSRTDTLSPSWLLSPSYMELLRPRSESGGCLLADVFSLTSKTFDPPKGLSSELRGKVGIVIHSPSKAISSLKSYWPICDNCESAVILNQNFLGKYFPSMQTVETKLETMPQQCINEVINTGLGHSCKKSDFCSENWNFLTNLPNFLI